MNWKLGFRRLAIAVLGPWCLFWFVLVCAGQAKINQASVENDRIWEQINPSGKPMVITDAVMAAYSKAGGYAAEGLKDEGERMRNAALLFGAAAPLAAAGLIFILLWVARGFKEEQPSKQPDY